MGEPSSFLDAQSEKDIFQKFNDLVKDRIGIFISHCLSSVRYADEIAKLYRLQQSGYILKTK